MPKSQTLEANINRTGMDLKSLLKNDPQNDVQMSKKASQSKSVNIDKLLKKSAKNSKKLTKKQPDVKNVNSNSKKTSKNATSKPKNEHNTSTESVKTDKQMLIWKIEKYQNSTHFGDYVRKTLKINFSPTVKNDNFQIRKYIKSYSNTIR